MTDIKLYENKNVVPVMPGTICDKCHNTITLGVFQGEIKSIGKRVFYCPMCDLGSELHPIRSKLRFK